MCVSPVGAVHDRIRSILATKARASNEATIIVLPAKLHRNIVDHLRRTLPEEGVGLLATSGSGARVVSERYYPGRNADRSALRYTMDPRDALTALRDMERRGTRLGAIVHSHPGTPPVPSATDLTEANFPGVLSLIVGFAPVVQTRAWSLVFNSDGIAIRGEEVNVEVVCIERDRAVR